VSKDAISESFPRSIFDASVNSLALENLAAVCQAMVLMLKPNKYL